MDQLDPQSESSRALTVVPHAHTLASQAYPMYEGTNPSYGPEDGDESNDGALLEYWRIVRRYKWAILFSSLAGALLGILIGLPMTPVYRASTSLEVLNVNENFMNTKESSPVTTSDFSSDVSEEETQVKLLESDWLADRVFAKLDPQYKPGKLNPRAATTGIRGLLHMSSKQGLTDKEIDLISASKSLTVLNTPRTRIIEVTADSQDPQLAFNFVTTLANEFMELNVEARRKTTEKVSEWLSGELEDARTKLRQAEDALQAYAGTSGLIFTDADSQESNIATEKLQQLQLALSTATTDRITKQSNYELAKHSPPDALPDVLNDQSLRDSMSTITTLRGQIADMSERFTPEYSKLKSAQAQLTALEDDFQRDRAAIVERVKNDYQEALDKERLLAKAYDTQTKEVLGQGAKAVQYNILKRDVDSSRQLYDTMLQQMKESSVAAALHASNVRIADPATLPEKPVWPNFKVLAPLGLLVGFFSCLGVVIFRERTDRTLQEPGELQFWTKLLELGTIPSLSAIKSVKSYTAKIEGPSARQQSITLPVPQSQTVDLITWKQGASVVAEAFRSVLTSILFVGDNGNSPRVLVFTSAGPGDGKTTVASNLAIAIAEIGRRVLIIDADLRRPRQHDLFRLPNERGLTDLLKEHEFSSAIVDDLILETQVPGLFLLPSGPPSSAAANLLYSPNLLDLLAKCKQDFDMIIIDTPPVLQLTDARVVGRHADGVVLVARAESTTRDAIMAVNQRFAEDRVRVLGTVLNDWNPKSSRNGYYGHYRNSYYSSYYNKN